MVEPLKMKHQLKQMSSFNPQTVEKWPKTLHLCPARCAMATVPEPELFNPKDGDHRG